jgi:hypothetical protein
LLVASWFILHIEPFLALALDRVSKFQIEIAGFRPNADTDTTYVVDGIPRVVATKIEDAFPQDPIGVDAEEAFTKCDENGDMEDGIGSQLVQLNPVNKKESPKELMNRHGEAVKEEISENYPKSFGRIGGCFVPRNTHLPIISEQPQFLQLPVLHRIELRSVPPGHFLLLHRLSAGGAGGGALVAL